MSTSPASTVGVSFVPMEGRSMRRMAMGIAVAAAVSAALSIAHVAIAGQVFVNVASNVFQDFRTALPTTPVLNVGDHVIWHFAAGGHSVTSGNPSTGVKSGLFDTNTNTTTSG